MTTAKCVQLLLALGVMSACGAPAPARRASAGSDAAGASGAGGASGASGAGRGGSGGGTVIGRDGQALTARVEGLEIELVTVACAGACAEVIAVARGGRPPYAVAWSDAVASAARSVCPDARTTYSVRVSDTPLEDGEFPYAGQTTIATVTAEVLQCPDGGIADAGLDASSAPLDGGGQAQCEQDDFDDPSCVELVASNDCFGVTTYNLPEPFVAGKQLCVRLQVQPSADLFATLSGGRACQFAGLSNTTPFSFSTPWEWMVCLPVEDPIEQLAIEGFLDPSVVQTVRYCPRCEY